MNKPVNFELAKLLKEKDINIYSEYRYTDFNGIERLEKDASEIFPYAPTISEVVMWLHSKHGIWIYCDETFRPFIIKDGKNKIYQGELSRLKKCNEGYITVYTWSSPAEAYEAAIKYCLTELIK